MNFTRWWWIFVGLMLMEIAVATVCLHAGQLLWALVSYAFALLCAYDAGDAAGAGRWAAIAHATLEAMKRAVERIQERR